MLLYSQKTRGCKCKRPKHSDQIRKIANLPNRCSSVLSALNLDCRGLDSVLIFLHVGVLFQPGEGLLHQICDIRNVRYPSLTPNHAYLG